MRHCHQYVSDTNILHPPTRLYNIWKTIIHNNLQGAIDAYPRLIKQLPLQDSRGSLEITYRQLRRGGHLYQNHVLAGILSEQLTFPNLAVPCAVTNWSNTKSPLTTCRNSRKIKRKTRAGMIKEPDISGPDP